MPGLIVLLLVVAGLAAYGNSFGGLFLLDDKPRIVGNEDIRQLWPPWPAMAHSSRPLVQLSLVVNYALGGLNPWGYHAFNLAVHLLAGLLLFGIVLRMLGSDTLRRRHGRAAPWLAGAVALVWIVHPLQTESVTYTIQRAESLMGLFLLLTLYCAIMGASSPHPRPWYVAAVIACALGMGSKEVMVVAPFVVLLYDRIFISASFTELIRRRWGLYLGLAATWLILAALLATSRTEEQLVFVVGLTPWRYAITQLGVIVHYLRLSIWPHPLVLDYSWPLADRVTAVLPAAAVVLALLATTAWGLYRRTWMGFWGAWFFLILAPTSSILPIADVAFEHRMYLPLAAVAAVAVIGGYEILEVGLRRLGAPDAVRRWMAVGLVTAVIAVLALVTARRNEDYRSEIGMWSDIVAKRPENARAHYNLGNVLGREGRLDEAIREYHAALRIKPDYVDAHINLGATLLGRDQVDEAIPHFTEALRLKPDAAEAHNDLGAALFRRGRLKEAIPHLSETVRLRPDSAGSQHNLGVALMYQGRLEEAIIHLSEAVRLNPNDAAVHNDLGNALARQGRVDEAVAQYTTALRIKPDYAEAQNGLATARARQGKPK